MINNHSLSERSHGALILNLGTPEKPYPAEVRKYLKEFLMDPLVLDIPYPLRWLIVNCAILPRRPATSAAAYQKVWTERGSPLLFHLLDLVQKVQVQLPQKWIVKPAMRYGKPSLAEGLLELKKAGVSDITLFPLYPQYSLAATQSSLQECLRQAEKMDLRIPIRTVDSFYDDQLFIKAFAQTTAEALKDFKYDHLLFSFHGLPERQIKKASPKAHCLESSHCCDEIREDNKNCYRAQCYQTAKLIAEQLKIPSSQYTVCFQSRLGRTPWIQPFTDLLYQDLPKKGVKRLGVVCPAFVADCLETLEEIQIRGKQDFLKWGGEDLKLVPSLNSSDLWARAVCEMIQDSAKSTVLC